MSLYVILMGVQGAGKGLQAKLIGEHFGIPQVSTGDLFREMRARTDDLARKVQDIMVSGQLVDDDTTNAIVVDRLAQADAQAGVILDGYPRNRIQAAFLERHLREKDARVNAVLLLELDLYVAFKRAFGRVTSADGASYNYYYNADGVDFNWSPAEGSEFPPRLDASLAATGEGLKRRPDDASADAIIKRIDTFLETTQPLINYFEAKGIVRKINADQSIEAVWADIQRALKAL
ncbi:MAG: nucleoside monophosphate kinase [Chloroflexota bacterium]|nr:nucleoside monophosphate kinase [Chloroflexota bacterium]